MTVAYPIAPVVGRYRLTTETCARLRDEIIRGRLLPRQRLLETVLAKDIGVSRTPVREALRLLVKESLVEETPRGFFVADLSVKDVQDLEQTNRALQGLASRLAAIHGKQEDMEELENAIARMEAYNASNDLEGMLEADEDVHRQILRMADNRWLSNMVPLTRAIIRRVNNLIVRHETDLSEHIRQHRRVVDAILNRDGERAEEAMREHLQFIERLLIEILEKFVVPVTGSRF